MAKITKADLLPPLILDWNSFKALNPLDTDYLVVDTESNGKDPRIPGVKSTIGIALACRIKSLRQICGTYIPIRHEFGKNCTESEFKEVKYLIENHKTLVGHNWKHDHVALENINIFATGEFYDTMIIEHLINGKQLGWSPKHNMMMNHKLDVLSRAYGGQPKEMPAAMVSIKNMMEPLVGNLWWGYVPAELMFEYSANDGVITASLYEKQRAIFDKFQEYPKVWKVDQEFIRVISRMESAGIRIDITFCKDKQKLHEEKTKEIKEQLGGLNPNSPKDCKILIMDKLGLKAVALSKKTGAPSFDKKAMEKYEPYLEKMKSPVAKLITAYRGYVKTKSANYDKYVELVSEDGRLRPNFNLHRTITRRLSCDKPPLQQLPRESPQPWNGDLKQAFIPKDGYTLWEIDYSQLELRIIAHYAKVKELIEVFNDPTRDVFKEMALATGWSRIYGPTRARQMIKTFCYMLSYGAGVEKVSLEFGISMTEAARMRSQFFRTYPGIEKLFEDCKALWIKNKYVRLWTGRRIRSQYVNKSWAALDYLAQGGGAEIVERAMIRVDKFIDWLDCSMVLQVHDSLVFEIKNGEENKWLPGIIERMMDVPEFPVTFAVEAKKWGTSEKYEIAA